MERVFLFLLLSAGYLVAAVLFVAGWRLRRAARIAIAVFAGAAVAAQTFVLCGLIAWGQAWSGGQSGAGWWWIIPAFVYVALTAGLLIRHDGPRPAASLRKPAPGADEEYGPLR